MTIVNKQRQVQEIIRCGRDPKYFINKYVKIQHPMRGTIAFETYPFQDDVIDALEQHRYNIIVKSRQLGISTTTAAYALWLALFHRDKNILCIATKLSTAQNFITKVKVAFHSLPKWLVLKPKTGDSKQHIGFANGSQVKAIPRSEDAGRSEAVTFLIVDEAAHIENFDDLWAALLPTLSEGGSACMLSSPKGAAGIFHKTWVDSVAGKSDFNPIELKWDVHPERDEEWLVGVKKMFNERIFKQEYMCDFLGSGDTYISGDEMEWLTTIQRPAARRDGPNGQVWIWKEPIIEHHYIISADVARGDVGGDYSTFHVFDNTEGEVVAEYMGHIRPDEFGKLLDTWGRNYNNALMAPELNTYGHHSITVLDHRDYPNMYYEQRDKNPHFLPGPDDLAGYNTQGKNKREQLLSRMEEVLRHRLVRIYSARFLHQLQGFIQTGKKAEARKGYHDDLVMSFAIGARILDAGAIDETARAMAYAMLAGTSHSTNKYSGVGVGPVSGGEGPKSPEYSVAYAVMTRRSMAEQRQQNEAGKNKKPTQPEAENDFGVRLPETIRRRLGGLSWLLR